MEPMIICDECGKQMESIQYQTRYEGLLEIGFFQCEHCGHVYIVSVTDEALRKEIKKYTRKRRLIRTQKKYRDNIDFQRSAQRLKERNMKRNRELVAAYIRQLSGGSGKEEAAGT